MESLQNYSCLSLSLQDVRILMKTQHLVHIIVFGVVTIGSDIMLYSASYMTPDSIRKPTSSAIKRTQYWLWENFCDHIMGLRRFVGYFGEGRCCFHGLLVNCCVLWGIILSFGILSFSSCYFLCLEETARELRKEQKRRGYLLNQNFILGFNNYSVA